MLQKYKKKKKEEQKAMKCTGQNALFPPPTLEVKCSLPTSVATGTYLFLFAIWPFYLTFSVCQ